MATVEKRISKLERAYTHLATKSDLQAAKADIIKWVAAMQLLGLGAIAAIIRLLG